MLLLEPFLADLRVASLYETEPVSDIAQGPFLNSALVGKTLLGPAELLGVAKAAELATGRRRGERWGPRPLDVDLLLYGDLVRAEPELTLPHLRLRERRFFLEPLAEIAPDLSVPPEGVTVQQLLDRLPAGAASRRTGWDPLGSS